MKKNMYRRIVIWGLAFLVSLYLGAVLFLTTNQRTLQYSPDGAVISVADAHINELRLIEIPVGKSTRLGGWFVPPSLGMPIIVYFSGNQGSFTDGRDRFADMVGDGYGLVAFDYEGFPMSPGEISEENILADALAAFDWAAQNPNPLILWGRSLGTGPATYVASLREADAVVLETPFTAAVDVAGERYPLIPVASLMKDQFLSREWILNVTEPVFVAHGSADTVIKVHHGRDLFALAPNARKLWIDEGGTHESLWADGLWGQARAFFGEVALPAR